MSLPKTSLKPLIFQLRISLIDQPFSVKRGEKRVRLLAPPGSPRNQGAFFTGYQAAFNRLLIHIFQGFYRVNRSQKPNAVILAFQHRFIGI